MSDVPRVSALRELPSYHDALRALRCLYIATEASVADEVNTKVMKLVSDADAEITRLREEVQHLVEQEAGESI